MTVQKMPSGAEIKDYMEIFCRNLKKSDFPALRHMIYEAWDFGYDADAVSTRELLDDYLYEYLAKSNFCKVAVADGTVISFLLGRCNRLGTWKHRLRYFFPRNFARFRMLFNRDGQKELREEHRIARADSDLIRYHRGQFDGELCLFATDERFRGHGAGVDLLRLFHAFLRENGAKDYFVYTDTYSNYEFYNRQGFRQISSETVDLGDGMEPKPTFFLYEYRLGDEDPF